MEQKNKAIIFDFDGVIADTFQFHREHLKKYLGVSFSVKEYQDWQRGNVFNLDNVDEKKKLVSEKLVEYFKLIEKDHFKVKSFVGINEVVKKLSENFLLFMVTSSSIVNINNFLVKENLASCFVEILGVEFHKSKSFKFKYILENYNLKKEEVLFVTDTSGDIFEANEVGINSVAVTWGFHTREILAESSPKFYVKKPVEILKVVGNCFL